MLKFDILTSGLGVQENNNIATPLPCIYPPKFKIFIHKDICAPVFTAALFAVAETWEQPKCSSVDDWV